MERDIKTNTNENYFREEIDYSESGQFKINKPHFERKRHTSSLVIGIGTTSEGFVALEQFFANIPSGKGFSFIIVYNSSFDLKSILVEIISKYTAMKLMMAQDEMRIEPNSIYIAPYKSTVAISRGILVVNRQSSNNKWERPIDTFFCSLAKEQKDKAVGIFFSSKSTDGIIGSIAIREAGGMVLAHETSNGMFRSRFENNDAGNIYNHIMSPDMMPCYLINYFEHFSKNDTVENDLPFDNPHVKIVEEDAITEFNTENMVFKLIDEFLPPCIIVDLKGQLLYVSRDSGKYLKLASGKVSLNIYKMLPENIIYIIRNAIERIKVDESTVTYSDIVFKSDNNLVEIIDLKIKPFYINENEQLIIIFFMKNVRDSGDFKFAGMLRSDIEIKESFKEMSFPNGEPFDNISYKVIEDGVNSDNIDNDMNNFCIGSVFLDRNLCVRSYTPYVKKEINLMDYDIGRPINHISHNFINENLAQNAIRVLNNFVSRENKVQSINGNCYIIRYSPYIEFENTVKGIVISLMDISAIKKTYEKNNYLSGALEQSACMVMVTNVDGKIEYINPKFTEVTGYTGEEIIGRDFGILKSGIQDAKFYKDLRETIASGKEWKGELCNKKKNGEIYWELTSISPVKSQDGVITHFIEIKEDITNQKIMLETLKNNEEKFRQVFDSIKDLIFMYGVNIKGVPSRLLEVNKIACEMLGYTKEELETMNMYDIIDEENIIDIHKINQNLLTQGHSTFEINYICKNGCRLPARVSCQVITSNGEKAVLIIAQDITEQKKNQEALLKSKERYELLVEYSPYAILIVSHGIILFSNIAGLNMFDAGDIDELVGKPMKKFLNIDFQKLINEQNICPDVEGKLVIPLEDRIIKPDGTSVYAEITAMPFLFEGKSTTLIMLRDITSRKHAEELQKDIEKSKKLLNETIEYDILKTEFFSNISHELRTPLNGLISTLQLLNMHLRENTVQDSNIRVTRYTDIMRQNSYRLLRLVNNMIDITKIDTGCFDLNLRNCNIVNIVEEITMSVADFIEDKVSLIFDTDVEEKIMACDPDKIERIMLNLLSNAVKFSKTDGNIMVNVYDKDERVLITVRDTGIGIPEDKLEIIFERFRQVDKSLTRNHEGSGIGLSLVKSLVEMHRGNISVKSEFGRGSEFSVELPVAVLADEISGTRSSDIDRKDNLEKVYIEFSDIYNLN